MSEYPEYVELQERRAEDRMRRRALASDPYPDYRQRNVLSISLDVDVDGFIRAIHATRQHLDVITPLEVRPLPRAFRRARGRRIAQAHAFVRRQERRRTAHRRAQRPVIKKGLTR